MRSVLVTVMAAGLAGSASAQVVDLRVSVENLAPQNSVAFAPLRVGFNNGTYDSFDNGSAASAAIVSIAEGGSGSDWFPAFMAADPTATLGTVVPNPAGPLLPGGTAFAVFSVDPQVNPFFTFGSMVVPSNDHFIGNDDPQQYRLFDSNGALQINSISQFGSSVWDAGSEVTDPMNAAFLAVGMNSGRTPENGVVNFNFTELDAYNGLQTGAGYTFDRQFGASDEIYRITFTVVPSPAGLAALGASGLVGLRRRRA
ncbi:MAG: spondin domain-containing protein [Phycisphaerales bacterium]